MIKISDFLDENLVLFLETPDRNEAIKLIVERLKAQKKITDEKKFYEAILNREAVVSTGIGMGVAIPHAKLPELSDFFIAVGIQKKGIDWGALDNLPVTLIFLIGGPDDKQAQYLKILSQLTLALRDQDRRKKMLTYTSPKEIINLFENS